MDLLKLDSAVPTDLRDPVVIVALDGWTDAGQGGSLAGEQLRQQLPSRRLGRFDPDRLFDYRDRRPLVAIDRGVLDDPEWPSLDVWLLQPPGGPDLVFVVGGEPDFAWRALCDDVVELALQAGAKRHVGLGSVPGPVPHTRPVRLIATSSDQELLEQMGRPHEQVVVPASCQVILETALRDAGLTTLGLWARVPHYVAGEYPAGAQTLLQQVAHHLQLGLDASVFDADVIEHRSKLDVAASSSPEVTSHIETLEEGYDADVADASGLAGPLPTGDQIAAELERFLRSKDDER